MKRWLLVVVLCAASTLSLPPLTDDVEALLPAPNSTFATFLVQLAKSDRVAVAQLDARVQDALLSFPKLEPLYGDGGIDSAAELLILAHVLNNSVSPIPNYEDVGVVYAAALNASYSKLQELASLIMQLPPEVSPSGPMARALVEIAMAVEAYDAAKYVASVTGARIPALQTMRMYMNETVQFAEDAAMLVAEYAQTQNLSWPDNGAAWSRKYVNILMPNVNSIGVEADAIINNATSFGQQQVQAVVLALVTDANFGGASALSLIGQLEDGNEAVTALSQLGK